MHLFTVVGIYHLENYWSDEAYDFTPNTVFAPKKALAGENRLIRGSECVVTFNSSVYCLHNLFSGLFKNSSKEQSNLAIVGVSFCFPIVSSVKQFQKAVGFL